VHMKQFLV